MKLAYADPPYVGQAKRHYGEQAEEVNLPLLIAHLQEFDGWALSASSPSLRMILPLCPPETRVAAWVKPFCIFKPNVTTAYAWEPVMFKPARMRTRSQPTLRDWLSCNITLKRGLVGAKPEAVCRWIFELLGAAPGDTLEDLFPGTGAVSGAWSAWIKEAEAA